MPIEDLARSDVVTAESSASVEELASTMKERDVGSIVITDGNEPTGIVTDRDLTLRVLAEGTDPSAATAADVMSTDLCTIDRTAGFYQATELMSENGVRRLPVRDGDELSGIITADDLTELLAEEQEQVAEVIRAQRPPY
ncbi:CBS domain-containing protein [Halostella sp. JP-L12]|uniref:CBS domain-containing protein n=1 Tax=Halostella TaxID=1843185 RepID=UPI000EF7A010|nr:MULTISPECIES: CBS domain-containing protein [Halostella]NHN49194.1 CBS domain-containing protein [Halostella sp. JP-L12]